MHFRSFALLLSVLLLLSSPFASQAKISDRSDINWNNIYDSSTPFVDGALLKGRLILHFNADAIPSVAKAKGDEVFTNQLDLNVLNKSLGVKSLKRLFHELPGKAKNSNPEKRDLLYTVEFDGNGHTLLQAALMFEALPQISSVEPDAVFSMFANLPNDPSLGQQWWLRNTSNGGKDIRALAAWHFNTGSSDIIVCDADSGVDWQHPDLGGSAPNYDDGVIWINDAELNGKPGVDDDNNGKIDDIRGWDFVHILEDTWQDPPQDVFAPDNDPMDYTGHGTNVAGCISAITNNGIGIASTNWATKVMAVRIGWTTPSKIGVVGMSFAAQALDYARLNGAHIFNASWGSGNFGGLSTAASLYINNGGIIVVAAGNANNSEASYLGGRYDTIAVAATNSTDSKSSFSSFGFWVDIAAPGSGIFTTAFNPPGNGLVEHTYASVDGTSFSSPIIAGALAFIMSVHPEYTPIEARIALYSAVDDIKEQNPGYTQRLGVGRLNLAKLFDIPFWTVPEILPTVTDALNSAEDGDEIRVLGGHVLTEQVQIPTKSIHLIGGWDANYETRDLVNNKTIIDPGASSGSSLISLSGVDSTAIVDGFEIRGGNAILSAFEPISGKYGGGVLISRSSPKIRNCLITGNTAGASTEHGGGGGVAVLGGSPILINVEIADNVGLQGSAVYVHNGKPQFRKCHIRDNISYPQIFGNAPQGGAVYLVRSVLSESADNISFYGGTISNHSTDGSGGGIFGFGEDINVAKMSFENNESKGSGGAIYLEDGSYTGSNNSFINNRITPGSFSSGGALHVKSASFSESFSHFEANHATLSGGAISSSDAASVSIDHCMIVGNTSNTLGSAVYIINAGTSNLSNSSIVSNTGASAGGNGVMVGAASATVSNNLFAFNGLTTTAQGDAYVCLSGSASFSCNLSFGHASISYSGCEDPTGSNGNVELDPLYCDLANDNYNLMPSSPALAANNGGCGNIGVATLGCEPTAVGNPVRHAFQVSQNAPNPFNPNTLIRFSVEHSGIASVRIFDIRGRVVQELLNENLSAGNHEITWHGKDSSGHSVASGTYFFEVRSANSRAVRKMSLLK